MNNLVFLYQQEREVGEFFSLTMLGHALELKGISVPTKSLNDIYSIKDSVVFMVKIINPAMGDVLKNNGNKIIIDMVDLLAHVGDRYGECLNYYASTCGVDKFLVRQKWVRDLLGSHAEYIPFHYDTRLDWVTGTPHDFTATKISFPYGDDGGMIMHKHFPELFDTVIMDGMDCFDFEKIKRIHLDAIKNNFYFSAKTPHSLDYHFKPCTKVASAAVMNRNIITSTDRCLEDILPADYPYYFTDNSTENFMEFYESKIKSPAMDEYLYGLECMNVVKQKTNIHNQVNMYLELLG